MTNVVQSWQRRVDAAMLAAAGLKFIFSTSYQGKSEDTEPYHDQANQEVEITRLVIDPALCDFDEECLPYFWGRFSDGVELLVGGEELFTHDARLTEFFDAVCAGFAVARELDFVGPFDLEQNGSDEQKSAFAEKVLQFQSKRINQFNTPEAFRVAISAN